VTNATSSPNVQIVIAALRRAQDRLALGQAGIQFLSLLSRLERSTSLDPRSAHPEPVEGRGDDGISKHDGMHGALAAMALLLLLAVSMVSPSVFAQSGADPTPPQFTDAAEERRFRALVSELRCVMCQNQSLADSNAQIAHDLRREVLGLMREGKSDAEVKQFLVARYGDFVLYKPQVGSKTWLLWFGPALLLLVGGFTIARIVHRRSAGRVVPLDDRQEW